MDRIVGVDLNPQYIEQARARYEGRITGLELHVADIQTSQRLFDPVDLIYVALVLEYVDPAATMSVLARGLAPERSRMATSAGGKCFSIDEFRLEA